MYERLLTYSDGGSRGNPGPAAIAFLIVTGDGMIINKKSSYLGIRTNNQSEYEALISALKAVKQLKTENVTCHLDSELVTRHLTGDYKVKNKELLKLWKQVQELIKEFKEIKFISVPRTNEYIAEADRILNITLDENLH